MSARATYLERFTRRLLSTDEPAPRPIPCRWCPEPAEGYCASCDGPVCSEHSTYSPTAGERFCELDPKSYLLGRTILRCSTDD